MPRHALISWLLAFGVLTWLSSGIVETHPAFAAAACVATLVFFATVVRGETPD